MTASGRAELIATAKRLMDHSARYTAVAQEAHDLELAEWKAADHDPSQSTGFMYAVERRAQAMCGIRDPGNDAELYANVWGFVELVAGMD